MKKKYLSFIVKLILFSFLETEYGLIIFFLENKLIFILNDLNFLIFRLQLAFVSFYGLYFCF